MKKLFNSYLKNLKAVKWWKYLLLGLQELFVLLCIIVMNSDEFLSKIYAYTFTCYGYEYNLGVMFYYALYTIGILIIAYLLFYVSWRFIFDSMLKDIKNAKRQEDSKKD